MPGAGPETEINGLGDMAEKSTMPYKWPGLRARVTDCNHLLGALVRPLPEMGFRAAGTGCDRLPQVSEG